MTRRLPVAVLAILFLLPAPARAAPQRGGHHRTGLIARDNVTVRQRPSTHARPLAVLVQQTQVAVISRRHDWYRVLIWDTTYGWVQQRDVVFRRPWPSVSTYRAPVIHYRVRAHPALALRAPARALAWIPLAARPGGSPVDHVAAGTSVTVTAWQQDSAGKIWYRIDGKWAQGDAIQFTRAPLASHPGHSRPIWARVAGKGVWLTLGTATSVAPDVLAAAAQRDGFTHLYVEAAISPLGFHGRNSVSGLLDAAHRRHIAVIAWVYPYLVDIAADVALTREVAAFRTASGQRFDGIAADLEQNFQQANVRAYSQLVRRYLGNSYLLVGVTYPPQSAPEYPFAEVGLQYDLVAPMDYWHQTATNFGLDYGHLRYSAAYGYRYAADSVAVIRRAVGPQVAIAPIGQTFDDFGRLEMGPNAPSAGELQGFLAGCKQSGAVGASFFQWMTTTRDEWQVIHAFRF